MKGVHPPAITLGTPPTSDDHGLVIAVNHYSRPGFGAWWIALSLAAAISQDIHWMMTSAWVYPDRLRSWTITPVSRWVIARIAHSYGFTTAPPMPPRTQDFSARAGAIRSLLRALDRVPNPVLGIAPEGYDSLDGSLQHPPDGVGHLLHHLWKRKMVIVPAGVYEENGTLITRFGDSLPPGGRSARSNGDRDQILNQVMYGIAACLPYSLRGVYA
jgi:hypothetical protein